MLLKPGSLGNKIVAHATMRERAQYRSMYSVPWAWAAVRRACGCPLPSAPGEETGLLKRVAVGSVGNVSCYEAD